MREPAKVAIVTGASQGLGDGIARGYRARGWRVIGVSRSIEAADEADWITLQGDVADPDTATEGTVKPTWQGAL